MACLCPGGNESSGSIMTMNEWNYDHLNISKLWFPICLFVCLIALLFISSIITEKQLIGFK